MTVFPFWPLTCEILNFSSLHYAIALHLIFFVLFWNQVCKVPFYFICMKCISSTNEIASLPSPSTRHQVAAIIKDNRDYIRYDLMQSSHQVRGQHVFCLTLDVTKI